MGFLSIVRPPCWWIKRRSELGRWKYQDCNVQSIQLLFCTSPNMINSFCCGILWMLGIQFSATSSTGSSTSRDCYLCWVDDWWQLAYLKTFDLSLTNALTGVNSHKLVGEWRKTIGWMKNKFIIGKYHWEISQNNISLARFPPKSSIISSSEQQVMLLPVVS